MSDGYTAVCADGTHVFAPTAPPSVVFADDKPIPLPSLGMFLQARSGPFGHLAIVKANVGGHALLIDRATRLVTDLGPTIGGLCVGLRMDGTPLWLDTVTTYRVGLTVQPDGSRGVPTPIPPGPHFPPTAGWLCLDIEGRPMWTADQIAFPVTYGGVPFALSSRPDGGDWAFGQARDRYDFLAYQVSTDRVFIAAPTASSQIPPSGITQTDGSAILARSLPADWFPSAKFVPYPVTPPVPPDPPIPPIPPQPPVRPFIERARTMYA